MPLRQRERPLMAGVARPRFRVERLLGRGGMGEVYQAYDRQLRLRVALKSVRFPKGESLLLFKHEFRALAGLRHVNLVTLYELLLERERHVFSMELLRGTDLLRHVWMVETIQDCLETSSAVVATRPSPQLAPATGATSPVPQLALAAATAAPRVDVTRLRAALGQLVEGVSALHRHGYLHRDIKPSNVVVTFEGRLVLLDFGVISTIAGRSAAEGRVGTQGYMAPEVAAGEPASPASDWYAVGAVLHQALTGQLPRPGAALGRERPDGPEDLAGLCERLLRVAPAERPAEPELRAALGLQPAPDAAAARARTHDVAQTNRLVGREAELRALHEALALTDQRPGCGVIVRIHAASGMGKTSLVQRFVEQAAARKPTLVLGGRCHERETLPFKALDAMIDALAEHLSRLPDRRRAALAPADAGALAQLFPVLAPVLPPAPEDARADAQQLRQRAVQALRALLRALAARRRLVLFIDDAQWGDRDSATMLEQLLAPPEAPDLLLVLAYRSDEARRSALLRALDDPGSALASHPYLRHLELAPLAAADARRLADELLAGGPAPPTAGTSESELAAESGGNPYLLHELVRYRKARAAAARGPARDRGSATAPTPGPRAAPAPTVDEMIRWRAARLPPRERKLLQLVAVGGAPLPQAVYHRAARLSGPERAELLPKLQAAGWVRLSGRSGSDTVEPAHDRIRETVAQQLTPARRKTIHGLLARALRATRGAPPDVLAEHLLAAGEAAQAARVLQQLAAQAEQTLAFDRAARAYERLLQLQRASTSSSSPGAAARLELTVKLGQALANAGRCCDAGQRFLEAAALAEPAAQRGLTRRAAQELLRGGDKARGLEVMRGLLAAAGMRLLPEQLAFFATLLNAKLVDRQLARGALREAPSASHRRLEERMELAWSLGPLLEERPVAVTHALLQSGRLALRLGDRRAFCRAMLGGGGYLGNLLQGPPRRWCTRITDRALAWADALRDPYLQGLAAYALCVRANARRDWSACRAHSEAALRLLEAQTGTSWEVTEARVYRLTALFWLGRLAAMAGAQRLLLQDARARGDDLMARYLALTYPVNLTLLVQDRPDELERQQGRASAPLDGASPASGNLELYRCASQAALDLYRGDKRRAHQRARESLSAVARLNARLVPAVTFFVAEPRARCALAEASTLAWSSSARRRLLGQAERGARRLQRLGDPCAVALARLIRGQLALLRGERAAARAELQQAAADFDAQQMALHREVSRYRLGQLVGGGAGDALCAGAMSYLQREGVVRPERFLAIFAPVEP